MVGRIHPFIFSPSQNLATMTVEGLGSYKLHKDKERVEEQTVAGEKCHRFWKTESEWTQW